MPMAISLPFPRSASLNYLNAGKKEEGEEERRIYPTSTASTPPIPTSAQSRKISCASPTMRGARWRGKKKRGGKGERKEKGAARRPLESSGEAAGRGRHSLFHGGCARFGELRARKRRRKGRRGWPWLAARIFRPDCRSGRGWKKGETKKEGKNPT